MPSLSAVNRDWGWLTSILLVPSRYPTALVAAWTLVHEMLFYSIFVLFFLGKRLFLIASIVYFGAIVIAALINKWAGLAVFVVLSALVVAWWLRARREERPRQTVPRPHAAGERRILVVANETVGGHTLRSMIL